MARIPKRRKFTATVDAWVAESERRMLAVMLSSAQEVFLLAKRNAPVDTGFLRASFQVQLGKPTPLTSKKRVKPEGHTHGTDIYGNPNKENTDIQLILKKAKLGDTIYGNWTANYAGYVEYGTSTKEGKSRNQARGMTRLAAQMWPYIVAEEARKIRKRFG